MNRPRRPRQLKLPVRTAGTVLAGTVLAITAVTACSSAAPASSAAGSASSGTPITIGMSLPMTGPVADVSKSGYQGYELWARQGNAAGGLLGRQVKLDMLDDGFDPNQTAADYTRLISEDHVN